MKVGSKIEPIRLSYEKIGIKFKETDILNVDYINPLSGKINISLNGKAIIGKRARDGKKCGVSFEQSGFKEVKSESSYKYNKKTKYEKIDPRGSHHFYGLKG
jgi:hypothetical protein